MFCVLNVERKKLNIIQKMFRFLARDEYSIKIVPVFKGAPFYLLDAKVCNDINWQIITENAGKCSKRLVVSENIKVPKQKGIGVFKSDILYKKMFQNTVLKILRYNNMNENPVHISVCDKNAKYTDFIFKLIPYTSKLTVVTENKEKYIKICDRILENTGLCISLLSEFDNAKIKIDIERNIMSVDAKDKILNIKNGESLVVDDVYKNLIPQGVNEYDFYSALYEFCGVFSLGECIFETVSVNNEKKLIKDIQFA